MKRDIELENKSWTIADIKQDLADGLTVAQIVLNRNISYPTVRKIRKQVRYANHRAQIQANY